MNARKVFGYSIVFLGGALANQIYMTKRLRPIAIRNRILYGLVRLQRDIQRSQVLAHERTMEAHGLALDHDCCAVCEERAVV
jgi:hypothetical protein